MPKPRAPKGLSPRVRGNPFPDEEGTKQRRSIPACAGEPIDESELVFTHLGLSPRVRGNRFRRKVHLE